MGGLWMSIISPEWLAKKQTQWPVWPDHYEWDYMLDCFCSPSWLSEEHQWILMLGVH